MLHKMLGSGCMWMSNITCVNPNIATYHACNDKRKKGIVEANIRGTWPSLGGVKGWGQRLDIYAET